MSRHTAVIVILLLLVPAFVYLPDHRFHVQRVRGEERGHQRVRGPHHRVPFSEGRIGT